MTITRTVSKLYHGKHDPDGQMCLLEAVAYVAGEPWSDHPACVSPVLGAYGRALNDAMPDDQRQRLLPFVPRLIGTAEPATEQTRAYILADAAVRVLAPLALRAVNLEAEALKLEALEPITSADSAARADRADRAARAAASAARADRADRAADSAAASAARAAASAARAAASADRADRADSAADSAARAAARAARADRAANPVWDAALAAFGLAIEAKA